MGVRDPSAQDETGCPGNLIQRLQPRKLVGRCGWVQKAGKEWLARREPLLRISGASSFSPLSPGCFVYLVKAGNVERMKGQFSFLSFST